jgi:hypothetical protein
MLNHPRDERPVIARYLLMVCILPYCVIHVIVCHVLVSGCFDTPIHYNREKNTLAEVPNMGFPRWKLRTSRFPTDQFAILHF